VLIWLRSNHGQELSYPEIAAGVGIKDGARLRTAVRVARIVAANRGDRLERFMPSQDPDRKVNKRPVFVTRYMRSGLGDQLSTRDAMSTARTAMKDMRRATGFAAESGPETVMRREFGAMAAAAEECITTVAGIDEIGPEVVRRENTSLLTQMIDDLEARLAESPAPRSLVLGAGRRLLPGRVRSGDRSHREGAVDGGRGRGSRGLGRCGRSAAR